MKIHQNKKQIFMLYMLGFLVGILYANLVSKQYMSTSGIFNEYFLHQYPQVEVIAEDYVWYIIGIRVVPLVAFCALGLTRIRKLAVVGTLVWTGTSSGIMAVAAVMSLGMKGIALFIVGVMPQFICYILVYVVLLWYFYTYPQSKWNVGKTVFVCLVFLMGIILEGYVNPIFMKLFINMIS